MKPLGVRGFLERRAFGTEKGGKLKTCNKGLCRNIPLFEHYKKGLQSRHFIILFFYYSMSSCATRLSEPAAQQFFALEFSCDFLEMCHQSTSSSSDIF